MSCARPKNQHNKSRDEKMKVKALKIFGQNSSNIFGRTIKS